MVRTFTIAIGAVGVIAAASQASPFLSATMELMHVGDEGDTYRLYAELEAGARIDAVYGNSLGELIFAPREGRTFYQNTAYGGPTSKEINSNFFNFVPSSEWDSYVSIGCLYQDGTPFGANALNNIGVDWGSFEAGGELSTDNGSWFVTPDDDQGQELNGRVFIGQFTIQGGSSDAYEDVMIQFNLQGKDADGNTWNQIGIAWVPAPGALALLGLVGMAGRRRRRA